MSNYTSIKMWGVGGLQCPGKTMTSQSPEDLFFFTGGFSTELS